MSMKSCICFDYIRANVAVWLLKDGVVFLSIAGSFPSQVLTYLRHQERQGGGSRFPSMDKRAL
jgi:hypothetical protein